MQPSSGPLPISTRTTIHTLPPTHRTHHDEHVGVLRLTHQVRDAVRVGVVHLAAVLLDDSSPGGHLPRRQVALVIRDEKDAAQQTQVLGN